MLVGLKNTVHDKDPCFRKQKTSVKAGASCFIDASAFYSETVFCCRSNSRRQGAEEEPMQNLYAPGRWLLSSRLLRNPIQSPYFSFPDAK